MRHNLNGGPSLLPIQLSLSTHCCLAVARAMRWLCRAASARPISSCAWPMQLCRFPISSVLLGTSSSGHPWIVFSRRSAFLQLSSGFSPASTGGREESSVPGGWGETERGCVSPRRGLGKAGVPTIHASPPLLPPTSKKSALGDGASGPPPGTTGNPCPRSQGRRPWSMGIRLRDVSDPAFSELLWRKSTEFRNNPIICLGF